MEAKRGKLIVYTGCSGVGKGTIMKELLKYDNSARLSVSATTRKPRPNEENGRDYFFISKDEFLRMIQNDEFLEYATYCGNFYGTPKKAVEKMLDEGLDVFLEIEVAGGMQIQSKFPDCISIFIMPPSMEDLEARLRGRGTEREEQISGRLQTALKEITYAGKYDYTIINHEVRQAVEEILGIVKNH